LTNKTEDDSNVHDSPPENVEKAPPTTRTSNVESFTIQREEFKVSETVFWKVTLGSVGLAVFVGAWEIYALFIGNPVRVATPTAVLASLYALLQNQIPPAIAGVSNIYTAILATLELIVLGFGVSLVGIPIGLVMGRWKAAEAIIDPWINALYAIPLVALIPLIYLAWGGSFAGALLVVFIFTVFTITLNTFHGVRYVSNSYAEVGKSFGASERQFFRHIILPASAPDIVAGMRLGLGRAVLGSIVAEALLLYNGLGYMMFSFQSYTRTSYMMATVSVIALLGLFFLNTPKLLERRLFRWKEGERLSRSF
jgi:NitT/TauT family transport system permease protein